MRCQEHRGALTSAEAPEPQSLLAHSVNLAPPTFAS